MTYVVEDDEAVRDSLRALLESYDLTVCDYGSAAAFLAADPAVPPACLVIDLHMPDMDGLELLELLRSRRVMLPVVMITGRGDQVLKDRARKAGAMVMLDKPLEEDVLLQSVRVALDGAKASASMAAGPSK